jgi:SAM-dependent methyltransferase
MAQPIARRVKQRLSHYPVRARSRVAAVAQGQRSPVISGLVESIDDTAITGWVEVGPDAPALRVALYIEGFQATTVLAVPSGDRRGDAEIRSFRLPVLDFWKYTRRDDQITVRVNGRPLPISGHGEYYRPREDGKLPIAGLRRRLSNGWVFASNGRLLLAKNHDLAWQAAVMSLYSGVYAAVREAKGYEPFFIYGSLLGAVRDNGFIGHDFDFDCAYVSEHRRGADVARELSEIARVLIAKGFSVESRTVTLHIYRPENSKIRIDLFHLFFDETDRLRFSWGVAGDPDFTRDMWQGVEEIPFAGSVGRIPRNAEAMIETIYGSSWRTPNAGFTWSGNRNKQARESRIPGKLGDATNWENYYAWAPPAEPSSFAQLLLADESLPGTVLDLGCGDGRDTLAFADAGRPVVGVDAAEHAIARAVEAAAGRPNVRFERLDLDDATALSALVAELRNGDEPLLFYGRFLLHALRPDTEKTVLAALAASARPGDVLALEFRTVEDRDRPKNRKLPFRRFIEPAVLQAAVEARGFRVVSASSGLGWSPVGADNPHLGRLIARHS